MKQTWIERGVMSRDAFLKVFPALDTVVAHKAARITAITPFQAAGFFAKLSAWTKRHDF